MSVRHDGQAAFPRPMSEDRSQGDMPDGNRMVGEQDGMSLRDFFAAAASTNRWLTSESPARIAEWSYAIADAMLAERRKGDMKTPIYVEDIQEQLEALTRRARGMGFPDAWATAHIYGAPARECAVFIHALSPAKGRFQGATFAACFFAAHRALDERDPALVAKTLGISP